jgi:predicted dehydrogenase
MPSRRAFIMQAASGVLAATSVAIDRAGATGATSPNTSTNVHQDPAVRPLKLAIVGTGEITPRYLDQAQGNERARFVATCARTIKSAKARAVEYGIDAWFDDHRKMYDTIKPDAVVVASPNALHAEHSIDALRRGIHVLCEKPMATRLEDCLAMTTAAQESGARLLCLPYDASAQFRDTLKYVNESTLGVFTGAEANLSIPGGTRGQGDWTIDPKMAGGGALLGATVYPVSRLISLLGPARRVTGFVNTLIPHRIINDKATGPIDFAPPPRDASKGRTVESALDDNVTLLIEWASGQQATVRTLVGTSFAFYNTVIYGRQGTLWTSQFGNEVTVHSPERPLREGELVSWQGLKECYRVPIAPVRGWREEGLIDHFIDCIQGKARPTCSGEQQLHVHEIIFKAYEGQRTGQVQNLQTTFAPWHDIDPKFHDTRSRFI